MATATITLTDDGDGAVDVEVDFGKTGSERASQAHRMALAMVQNTPGKVIGEVKVEKTNG